MATYLDGNVRRATPNTVTAMRQSAETRRCPSCRRKSALVQDADMRATYCRWGLERRSGKPMCDYYREWDWPPLRCENCGQKLDEQGFHSVTPGSCPAGSTGMAEREHFGALGALR